MQRSGGRGGFRGGRGGDRGRGGGRSFGGGRGGGRGGWVDYGPPDTVVEAGVFEHPCEGEAVCKLSNDKVRYPWRLAYREVPRITLLGTHVKCSL